MMTRAFEKSCEAFLQRIARDGLENSSRATSSRGINTLFSDIRSFHHDLGGHDAAGAFRLPQRVPGQIAGPIDHFGGFIDKFIGTHHGAVDRRGRAGEAAVKAAIGMQRRLAEWNTNARARRPSRSLGVGIQTGLVMREPSAARPGWIHGHRRRGQPRLAPGGPDQALRRADHRQRDSWALLDKSVFERGELPGLGEGRSAPVPFTRSTRISRARRWRAPPAGESFARPAAHRRRDWEVPSPVRACLQWRRAMPPPPADRAQRAFPRPAAPADWDGSFAMDHK